MASVKTIGLSFLGAVFGVGGWLALDLAGVVPDRGLGPQEGGFEQRVRDYLIENPEVLVESLQRMEEKKRAAQIDEIAQIIAARSEDIFNDPETPVGGNPQGDVSLVEFFDYNCPYCRRVAPTLVDIEKDDPGLRLVYKEWPILGPNSEFAARAALASRAQGKYVAFHKALMLSSGRVDDQKVFEVAAQVGLDVDRLKEDMAAPEISGLIERNRALARTLRVNGTPAFVIGDQMLRGAADAEVIRSYIRRAREK